MSTPLNTMWRQHWPVFPKNNYKNKYFIIDFFTYILCSLLYFVPKSKQIVPNTNENLFNIIIKVLPVLYNT